jgi:hypothetical protein
MDRRIQGEMDMCRNCVETTELEWANEAQQHHCVLCAETARVNSQEST